MGSTAGRIALGTQILILGFISVEEKESVDAILHEFKKTFI